MHLWANRLYTSSSETFIRPWSSKSTTIIFLIYAPSSWIEVLDHVLYIIDVLGRRSYVVSVSIHLSSASPTRLENWPVIPLRSCDRWVILRAEPLVLTSGPRRLQNRGEWPIYTS